NPSWLFRIIKGPAFHATIFFILGGFIFTSKFASKAAEFKTFPFLKKRFFELYPLHAITTVAMIIILLLHQIPSGNVNISKLAFSAFMHLSLLWSFFPFNSYSLNTPSWALSAFFLCYLLFGPLLKLVAKINNKRYLFAMLVMAFIPLAAWSIIYRQMGNPPEFYNFFHIFGLIRFFEFVIGMLLARFFQITTSKPRKESFLQPILCDCVVIISIVSIFFLLQLHSGKFSSLQFISYHLFLTPFYVIILYTVATEKGLLAKLFSLPVIRKTGRSSFYPYLIHIPLINIITYTCENFFGYKKFLHEPLNITLFIVILYGASYIYVNNFRKRKLNIPPTQKELEKEALKSMAKSDISNIKKA
ncbi:MAG: acyltransferase, partial [Fibrobacter sp.]|nr:acyltransferase [Fibrobacter sp.]